MRFVVVLLLLAVAAASCGADDCTRDRECPSGLICNNLGSCAAPPGERIGVFIPPIRDLDTGITDTSSTGRDGG